LASLFEVSPDDIFTLDDEQLRELTAKLAIAHLRSRELDGSGVTWGGDQRAPDGGIDVRVEAPLTANLEGYVPAHEVGFQVKAEDMPRGKIANEMMPKGQLRQSIFDLATSGGAYVIVCSKGSTADAPLKDRRRAMADCIREAGLDPNTIHLDFYDRRRLADWAQEHPSIVSWVLQKVGKATTGWQPFGAWSYRAESKDDEYLLDNQAKVQVSAQGSSLDVLEAINQMRGLLAKPGTAVRLVGLSGVGKTRLVQALFDARVPSGNAALQDTSVLYTDLADAPTPTPQAMVESLNAEKSSTILIVDNCGAELHERLAERISKDGSPLRLVTVEYDIREETSEGTNYFRLEPSGSQLIGKLLKSRYAQLDQVDADRITEAAGGNARIAFALASAVGRTGTVAGLTDEALFDRLFQQKNPIDHDLKKTAETCSLVYSFDGENFGEAQDELTILSKLSGLNVQTMYRNLEELKRRGLLQSRSKWRAILPHAVANRLADRAIENTPVTLIRECLVDNAPARLRKSFSRRLGYLHVSPHAASIAKNWLTSSERFSNFEALDQEDIDCLVNLAPVETRAVLELVDQLGEAAAFLDQYNPARDRFSRIAQAAAFEDCFFLQSAGVLARFSRVASGEFTREPCISHLHQLFQLYLSGTHAEIDTRISFIRGQFETGDEHRGRLALALVEVALETHHWTGSADAEFGARTRDYGWRPKCSSDIRNWFLGFVALILEIGTSDHILSGEFRDLFAQHFRGLWLKGGIPVLMDRVAREFVRVDGWQHGWVKVRETLGATDEGIPAEYTELLEKLEADLRPKGLVSEVKAKVFGGGFDILADESQETGSRRWEQAQLLAERLGAELGRDAAALGALSTDFLIGTNNFLSRPFGMGIGKSHARPGQLFDLFRATLANIGAANASLSVLLGAVAGVQSVNPEYLRQFLDEAVDDDVWGEIFTALQIEVGIDKQGITRLTRCFERGVCPTWTYQNIGYAQGVERLAIEDIEQLTKTIGSVPESAPVIVGFLNGVLMRTEEASNKFREKLRDVVRNHIADIDWISLNLPDGQRGYDFENLVKAACSGERGLDFAKRFFDHVVSIEITEYRQELNRSHILNELFERHGVQMLTKVFALGKDGAFDQARHILGDRDLEHHVQPVNCLKAVDILEWCSHEPVERTRFLLPCLPIFGAEGLRRPVNELFKLTDDKGAFLEMVVENAKPQMWSGSRSQIIRSRANALSILEVDQTPQTIEAIRECINKLIEVAEREAEWETEQSRERDQTFE